MTASLRGAILDILSSLGLLSVALSCTDLLTLADITFADSHSLCISLTHSFTHSPSRSFPLTR